MISLLMDNWSIRLPNIEDIQKYCHNNLNYLWDEYKRSLNPAEYPVDLSPLCWENKRRNIELVSERVRIHDK